MAYRHDIVHHKIHEFQINEAALWVSSGVHFFTKSHKFWILDENDKALGLYGTCINIPSGQHVARPREYNGIPNNVPSK
jgi:hypothetical protein